MRRAKLKLLVVCIVVGCLVAAGPAYAKSYPNFRIITLNGWEEALGSGDVRPMTPTEWSVYMTQFNNPDNLEGDPYPVTTFREATLSVCGGGGGGGGCAGYEDAGLVMAWGDGTEIVDNNYASAWVYQYRADPDLSNSTITVTVEPPCGAGISTISLGLQDNIGRIRSWTWNVVNAPPGVGQIQCSPIPPNILTTITINLAQTGVGAATPQAASYSNYNAPPNPAPAFNIKNVMAIIFDENAIWLASMPVPPPGGAAGAWNYWRNLTVTLNPPPAGSDTDKWFIKWSQRPVEWSYDPNFIFGWDERSDYNDPCNQKIMADDWNCKDDRPITDIHWWGSFIGWIQPHPPPIVPKAFHIGIWTDTPVGADPCYPFSHPGRMVWENYCDNWVWNFYGYDKDPCDRPEHQNETCFQYAQLLSEDEWFYQDPCAEPNVIYWLSIAPVFNPNDYNDPNFFPWGWKSRPHNFQDDATSITSLADGSWPPTVGSQWNAGTPLKGPSDETWDLAFELTTNEGLSGDLNFDAKVDFKDFARFADRWLRSIP